MNRLQTALFILPFLLISACSAAGTSATPTLTPWAGPPSIVPEAPTGTATSLPLPTLAPGQDACDQAPLRAYLQQFAVHMVSYELSLAQVFGLTMRGASKDALAAAIVQSQQERDALANTPAPYCAQKMQTEMLSSMDHTISALTLYINDDTTGKARTELRQAQLDFNVAKTEFTTLSIKAGLGADSTPAP